MRFTLATVLAVWATAQSIVAAAPTSSIHELTETQLRNAVPKACVVSATKAECSPPSKAVGLLNASFKKYDIASVGQQAALIALMNFESGGFTYKTNLNPANHGQGTYSQMQFPAIDSYVQSIPALKTDYAALKAANMPEDQFKDAVLKLANRDEYVFGAAAWYLKESGKCKQDVWDALNQATDAGFVKYIQCINTDPGPRMDNWHSAIQALKA
ncbi:hypothetical protein H4R33_000508 [Dimargaris cristalligena]|uniref:Lysozyme-like domain-containing protein n=1 Tax=Dimargaris cristalligena TaxID=215637 RepID=A0A4Q0A004_9FUNG|nr:hypothetical protein H4R33_000508 [Dimargaris cristalligena]RKP38410.1 hypothetical protein BJ085DRAFT_33405 [Dimargaris cristalligena]|eukprot:RKP38410.1 hypothetical protein BJ085DRAFT_33405 [Dimargaris cristalligena]